MKSIGVIVSIAYATRGILAYILWIRNRIKFWIRLLNILKA